jgi:DNA-binding SARP family transcriptional activator
MWTLISGASRQTPGGPKQRALLALLVLHANQVLSTDRLIDELWGDDPPGTARAVLPGFVSSLRRELGPNVILTRSPGYLVELEADRLDLGRFESLVAEGKQAAERGDPAAAAGRLREALGLWRGDALADLVDERFAGPTIFRLEELRLAALESRIEADLSLGRHGELVGELVALVADHPLRERLRAQLMLALYRSGRQAEALEAYRDARRLLVEELGIEPSTSLQALEGAILRHEPALDEVHPARQPAFTDSSPPGARAILLVTRTTGGLDTLIAIAEPLAARPARELVVAQLVSPGADLAAAASLLHDRRTALVGRGTSARAAVLTSDESAADAVRLASQRPADLLLVDATDELIREGSASDSLVPILSDAPCDVGIVAAGDGRSPSLGSRVLVPFGGAEHEWAAAELAAAFAEATGAELTLMGTVGNDRRGKRDASRLLAAASLLVQQVTGIPVTPLLAAPGAEAVVDAAAAAGLVFIGLSERWRKEGIGATRLEVARRARSPVVLVRGGTHAWGLGAPEGHTRYTWSLCAT